MLKERVKELLTHVGEPYQMFFDDGMYMGCFKPVYFLYPNYPHYPLKFDSNKRNYVYGIKCIKNHCIEISKQELQQGDIIATEYRGELHVGIFYEFGKLIEVYKDHTLQIGRLNKFKDYKCFRVIK